MAPPRSGNPLLAGVGRGPQPAGVSCVATRSGRRVAIRTIVEHLFDKASKPPRQTYVNYLVTDRVSRGNTPRRRLRGHGPSRVQTSEKQPFPCA